MSRWPWSRSFGADSRPGVAGTCTARLRASSSRTSNPWPSAHARTCSITSSSWRDGRAIFVSASKCSQNGSGSSPASTELPVAFTAASSCEPILEGDPVVRDRTTPRVSRLLALIEGVRVDQVQPEIGDSLEQPLKLRLITDTTCQNCISALVRELHACKRGTKVLPEFPLDRKPVGPTRHRAILACEGRPLCVAQAVHMGDCTCPRRSGG